MASSRIKGITVEIGGDTTRLSSALKGLDADLSKTQSQLRDVDKLLKLDPHNTELLAQKHKLLSQAVGDTSERLKKLKEARKSAEENLGNYDKWKEKYEPVRSEIEKTSKKLNELKVKREEMEKAGDIDTDEYKALSAQIDDTARHLDDLKKKQKEINDEFGNPISPEQYDSLKREIIDTENKLKSLKTQAGESAVALQKIAQAGEGFKALGGKISDVGKALAPLSGAAAVGLGAATKAAIDYETAFTGVMKTNDELIDNNGNVIVSYDDLSDAIKDLSTRTAASKSEIAAVMEGAGQLGVGTEYLADFTEAMVMLGDTTNLSADAAATAIAKFANITNMSLDNADRLGAALVDLGNNFATDEQSIMEMATRLAGAGHQIGLSEAEILGFATALSSVGIEAEMGGSAFSKAMIKMQVATETGKDAIQKLEETAGMSFHDIEVQASIDSDFLKGLANDLDITKQEVQSMITSGRNLIDFSEVAQMSASEFAELFKTDAPAAMDAFIRGLGDTDAAGESTIQMLQDMGFTEVRLRDTLTRAASAQDLFSNAVAAGNNAWNENTALTAEAEKRYGTTEAKISQVKETVSNLAIDLGETLLPLISDILAEVKKAVEWFSSLDASTKERIVKIGLLVAALSPLLIGIGNLISLAGSIMALAPALGAAITVMTGPVGIAVAAVAALGAAFALAYNKSERFREFADRAAQWIKDHLTPVLLGLGTVIAAPVAAVAAFGAALVSAYKKSETFRNVVNGVFVWFADTIAAAATWGADFIDNFVSGLDEVPVIGAVTKIAKTIFDFLHFSEPEKGPLANFHTFAPDMIKLFASGITDNKGLVENASNLVAGLVKTGLDTVKDKIADVRSDWENKWGDIQTKAADAGKAVAEKCAGLGERIQDFRKGFADSLSTAASSAADFRDKAAQVWDAVKQGAGGLAERVAAFRQNFSGDLSGAADSVSDFRDKASKAWDAVKQGASDLDAKLSGAFSNIGKNVGAMKDKFIGALGAIGDKVAAAKTWGSDLVTNLSNGISSKMETLQSAVNDAASAVADRLGFSEPKTGPLSNFHTFAPDMMDLFAKGIRDNLDSVSDAATQAASAVRDSFSFSDGLAAMVRSMAASTEPVKAGLSVPIPYGYPNIPATQNAQNSAFNQAYGGPNAYRPAPVNFSVNNIVGSAIVERKAYQYRPAEDARRGPSFVKQR